MNIISWNVNGIRAVMRKDFEQQLKNLNPDILCLQETKAQDHQVEETLEKINGYHIYSNSAERKGYSGTAILSKKEPQKVTYDIGVEEHDKEGRIITADYGDFYLVTAYVPNSGNELVRLDYRTDWDKELRKYILTLEKEKPVILCGDLNVAHQDIDIARPKPNYNKSAGFTQKEIDGLSALLDEGFIDVWRSQHPDEVKYSWWSYRFGARKKNIGWRIDYFIASEKIADKIKSSSIMNDVMGSDHCPVSIELDL